MSRPRTVSASQPAPFQSLRQIASLAALRRMWLLIAASLALAPLVACGGSSDKTPGATATRSAAGSGSPTSGDACLPLTDFMGIPASGLASLTSTAPRTETGKVYTAALENVLDKALGGADPTCIAEIQTGSFVTIYSVFKLDKSIGGDAQEKLKSEFASESNGAATLVDFANEVGASHYVGVGVSGFQGFGGVQSFIYLAGDRAVLLASGTPVGAGSATATSAGSATRAPATTTPGAGGDLVAETDSALRPALEAALSVRLEQTSVSPEMMASTRRCLSATPPRPLSAATCGSNSNR